MDTIARSRTEAACRVERARMLLAYRADPSACAVGASIGVTHQTVLRCLARAWVLSLACRKARDLGDPRELWTTRLLARHVRGHAAAAGYPCLASLAQGTVREILGRDDVKPHKMRYYLERRDAAFEEKMAEVLRVYREVAILRASETTDTAIKLILDNRSAHVSKDTKAWIAPQPEGRFTFVWG